MTPERTDRNLRICAALFALLAVTNFLKPLELYPDHGFVLFGQRLHGTLNLIVAPLFGVFLLAYAAAIVRKSPWALTMGRLYAAYVVVNLFAWNVVRGGPKSAGEAVFGIAYMAAAVFVAVGAWILLARRQAEPG